MKSLGIKQKTYSRNWFSWALNDRVTVPRIPRERNNTLCFSAFSVQTNALVSKVATTIFRDLNSKSYFAFKIVDANSAISKDRVHTLLDIHTLHEILFD